jgi:hypothetical protein
LLDRKLHSDIIIYKYQLGMGTGVVALRQRSKEKGGLFALAPRVLNHLTATFLEKEADAEKETHQLLGGSFVFAPTSNQGVCLMSKPNRAGPRNVQVSTIHVPIRDGPDNISARAMTA